MSLSAVTESSIGGMCQLYANCTTSIFCTFLLFQEETKTDESVAKGQDLVHIVTSFQKGYTAHCHIGPTHTKESKNVCSCYQGGLEPYPITTSGPSWQALIAPIS